MKKSKINQDFSGLERIACLLEAFRQGTAVEVFK
jgi:hypothetical protein